MFLANERLIYPISPCTGRAEHLLLTFKGMTNAVIPWAGRNVIHRHVSQPHVEVMQSSTCEQSQCTYVFFSKWKCEAVHNQVTL